MIQGINRCADFLREWDWATRARVGSPTDRDELAAGHDNVEERVKFHDLCRGKVSSNTRVDDRVSRAASEDREKLEIAEEEDYDGMHVEDYENLSPNLLIPHDADKKMANINRDPGFKRSNQFLSCQMIRHN